MNVLISEDIVQATRMTEKEINQELAILLFQKEKLSIGQASQLAGINLLQFQHLLASRQIPVHYDVADFKQDLETLKELNRL